jgi:SPP1 family predicted phage head-tail adaptor
MGGGVIGNLDRRITIQRATGAVDAFNEPVASWSSMMTVWAQKKDVSDRERFAAAETGAVITTRFTVRWSQQTADVSPKDRIVSDGRSYDIHGIKEIGRRRFLEITAAARAE